MSALAAPIPDKKPASRPSAKVRRMQRTPIGPTGAAMEKPIKSPRRKISIEVTPFDYKKSAKTLAWVFALLSVDLNC
jgi:hypothetical protein